MTLASVLLASAPASAQSVTAEVDVSGGVSTENVRAGAAQARLFGASASDWRFFVEATFGGVDGQQTDAFSAAYPYDRRLRPMEMYVEKMFRPRKRARGRSRPDATARRSASPRAAITATPASPARRSSATATASRSRTRPRRRRSVLVGTPRLYGETSFGVPQDEGSPAAQTGVDVTVRVQGYYKSFIVGASRIAHRPRQVARQLCGRGEWSSTASTAAGCRAACSCAGNGSSGSRSTRVATRRRLSRRDRPPPRHGPGDRRRADRAARLRRARRPSFYLQRFTAGARVRLPSSCSGQVNVIHQPSGLAAGRTTALDVGLTCTIRR